MTKANIRYIILSGVAMVASPGHIEALTLKTNKVVHSGTNKLRSESPISLDQLARVLSEVPSSSSAAPSNDAKLPVEPEHQTHNFSDFVGEPHVHDFADFVARVPPSDRVHKPLGKYVENPLHDSNFGSGNESNDGVRFDESELKTVHEWANDDVRKFLADLHKAEPVVEAAGETGLVPFDDLESVFMVKKLNEDDAKMESYFDDLIAENYQQTLSAQTGPQEETVSGIPQNIASSGNFEASSANPFAEVNINSSATEKDGVDINAAERFKSHMAEMVRVENLISEMRTSIFRGKENHKSNWFGRRRRNANNTPNKTVQLSKEADPWQ